jgi:hypothetical protein
MVERSDIMGAEISYPPQNIDPTSDRLAARTRALAESRAICEAIGLRLVAGTLPPDDAFWWTRIATREVLAAQSASGASE